MAKTLVRPSLYDEDFLAWTEQQAALVCAGRLDQLDLANLAEELDTMGRSEWGELENRLEVLLMQMLKCDHQPEKHTRSWDATINEQRSRLRRLFRRSPRVRRDLGLTMAEVYPDARHQAAIETGLEDQVFPEELPYGVEQILGTPPAKPGRSQPARRRGPRK